jgi:hypothetical protein
MFGDELAGKEQNLGNCSEVEAEKKMHNCFLGTIERIPVQAFRLIYMKI